VLAELQTGDWDAQIRHLPIVHDLPDPPDDAETAWRRECIDRYLVATVRYPSVTKRLRPTTRSVTLRHPLLARRFLPFGRDLGCWAGAQWFCANARAAAAILRFHERRPELARHYRTLKFPEESYFQCILASEPGLRLCPETFRHTDFLPDEPHPRTLDERDLPALLASPAHFARKVDPVRSAGLLDRLDGLVGAGPYRTAAS
jgi:hypothetical protein